MNKAEFTERLHAIGTEENEVQRRELIAQLIEDGGNDYDAHETAVTERDEALQHVGELQLENKRLFTRIGVKQDTDPDPDKPPEKRTFANLFNDKGGLK